MGSESIRDLERGVVSYLAGSAEITQAFIRETIAQYRCIPLYDSVADDQAEQLARDIEARFNVTMTIGGVLRNKAHEPWLDPAKASINPYFWDRYKQYLLQHKGFPQPVVVRLGEVTDRVLGLTQDPNSEGPWDRRGLVVGHVQSGKTANYIGLACKAADAGYKLIVVIAGIHNNLRNQTQERVDEGFVGRDSARLLSRQGDHLVGAGRIDASRRPMTFTNSTSDFRKATATAVGISLSNLSEPAVLVIKKNPTTLRNLIDWIATHNTGADRLSVELPMLVIDDEADNASINVRYDAGEVSRINGLIREMLGLFKRSCYIGYTATPFANIFIDPDTEDQMIGADLFPRDFIVSLDAPSNYFGAEQVFRADDLGPVRYIDDHERILPLKHKIGLELSTLPASLEAAVRTFLLARAIRLCRSGPGSHNSMLVNASRFTRVHGQIRSAIAHYLDDIQVALRVHGGLSAGAASADPRIAQLKATWTAEYSSAGAEWDEVFAQLNEAVAPVKVVEVNTNSSGVLDYRNNAKHGLNVIAVGGLSLSRGLTLEGLTVSYFLRNSMMYDTLMQMARWFGYRPGYDDLCRVWMPEDAAGWYSHIAESIEMLRRDLRAMEAAGATPLQFGLKVRSHPDSLIVTARNKMGSGQRVAVKIGLANRFVETTIVKRDEGSRRANLGAVLALAEGLAADGHDIAHVAHDEAGRLLSGVPVAHVLAFMRRYDNHQGSHLSDPGPICRYIEERELDELAGWDVLFASRAKALCLEYELRGEHIYCQMRTLGKSADRSAAVIGSRSRVASRGVERSGLTPIQIQEARDLYVADLKARGSGGDAANVPDWAYRQCRKRPLLVVHLLDLREKGISNSAFAGPVVAWSLSLPGTEKANDTVEYVVGTVWMRENFSAELEGEDDYDADN